MLRIGPDLERAESLLAERGGELGRPLRLLAETTSTNDEAKRAAQSGAPHGATWVTEAQTAGRGRQGRSWVASPGEALLFSVLLRVDASPARVTLLPVLAGLVVQAAVAKAAPAASVRVKWPNDVVAEGAKEGPSAAPPMKKLGGVLVEAITAGSRVQAVIVGIGVNVHSRHFPDEIAGRATSVALLSSGSTTPPDRAELLADILAGLDRELYLVLSRGLGLLRARLDAVDVLRGRQVENKLESPSRGVAQGIDDDGRLVVTLEGGRVVRWSAGEVHLAN